MSSSIIHLSILLIPKSPPMIISTCQIVICRNGVDTESRSLYIFLNDSKFASHENYKPFKVPHHAAS